MPNIIDNRNDDSLETLFSKIDVGTFFGGATEETSSELFLKVSEKGYVDLEAHDPSLIPATAKTTVSNYKRVDVDNISITLS